MALIGVILTKHDSDRFTQAHSICIPASYTSILALVNELHMPYKPAAAPVCFVSYVSNRIVSGQ